MGEDMKKRFFSHKTAFVDKGAKIGPGTQIWHFSHIMKGAKVGRDCRIGQNVVIHKGVVVGNNVKIQNNVSVYGGVVIENNVFCGPSVVFTNVSRPRANFPRDPLIGYEPTLVKEGATLGANSTIVCGHTLGRFCLVGAGSVVTGDIPDYALVYGNPAKLKGWVCECAQEIVFHQGNNSTVCKKCGRSYKKQRNNVTKSSN